MLIDIKDETNSCDQNKRMHVKIITKLTNLKFYQELISIMVNKGRIHKEIENFFRYSSNLERKLQKNTTKSKIVQFGSVFVEK